MPRAVVAVDRRHSGLVRESSTKAFSGLPLSRARLLARFRAHEPLLAIAGAARTHTLEPSRGTLHGTHLRSPQTHHVRALGPHGEAVPAHRQGDRDRGQERGVEPRGQPGAAPRGPERARRQHAEGQGRGGDRAGVRPRRHPLRGDQLRGLRAARRRHPGDHRDRQPDPHRGGPAQRVQQAQRQPGQQRQRRRSCSSTWAPSGSTPRASTRSRSSST